MLFRSNLTRNSPATYPRRPLLSSAAPASRQRQKRIRSIQKDEWIAVMECRRLLADPLSQNFHFSLRKNSRSFMDSIP